MKEVDEDHALLTEHQSEINDSAGKEALVFSENTKYDIKKELITKIRQAFDDFKTKLEQRENLEVIKSLAVGDRELIGLQMTKYREVRGLHCECAGLKHYITNKISGYSQICKSNGKMPSLAIIKKLAAQAAEQHQIKGAVLLAVHRSVDELSQGIARYLVWKTLSQGK